jgi:hypothetical protein
MRWLIVFGAILAGCVGEIGPCEETREEIEWSGTLGTRSTIVPHDLEETWGVREVGADCTERLFLIANDEVLGQHLTIEITFAGNAE